MTTYQVPAGQDGVTLTLTSPVTVRWPHATPIEVQVAAVGGSARFGFRGSAAPDAPGVSSVADGQAVTVSTRVEATPLVLQLEPATASAASLLS